MFPVALVTKFGSQHQLCIKALPVLGQKKRQGKSRYHRNVRHWIPDDLIKLLNLPLITRHWSGKKKPININNLGGTVSGTNGTPSLGQAGPCPGTNWDRPWNKPGRFLFTSTVKSPFCPVCPWDGWGFVPGTIVPQGPSENVYAFSVYWFFPPPNWVKASASASCMRV